MPSRFYSQKDIDTFDKFNKELVGNLNTNQDGIIYQPVVLYKISVYDTEVNMYGESADGKVYKPGVQVSCLVEADDQTEKILERNAGKENPSISFLFGIMDILEVKESSKDEIISIFFSCFSKLSRSKDDNSGFV